ncbi:Sterile alpha and TIR motif-containing protein tir-1 [Holothuria leucospilota]|uniref:Sterile alpha and TIR motif-containing protein tir-1 n=1 Tax=Holothuria leucospilota TaxID=206669 RepID=A0A9Q1HIF5_HOLLE|nr:Sterile alpha and TIR motif-containing protein tir-1 [Holothuria leucospilota]
MMSGKQFRLPPLSPNKGKGPPEIPSRLVPPPLPGRQPDSPRPSSLPLLQPTQPFSQKNDYSKLPDKASGLPAAEGLSHKPVILQLKPPDVESEVLETSQIANLVLTKQLPFAVRLKHKDHHPMSNVVLEEGELLQLHFLYKTTRIYATGPKGNDLFLPICARQMYAILPIDPVHDDKLYTCTADLINAKPLPQRVRIEEAHFSDHPGEAQEVGDIIEVEHIEKRPVPIDSDNPPQKSPWIVQVTVQCLRLTFSPCLRLSNSFPCHWKDVEYHVVATTANSKQVLSIPITWQGQVEVLDNASLDRLFRSLLPPIYPLVNTTWGLKEPGRCELQPNMKEVAQPPLEILDEWSRTKEGQEFSLKAGKQTVESYKIRIEELVGEKERLNNEMQLYRSKEPPPPLPREDVKPPTLPRKPPSLPSPSSPTKSSTSDNDDEDYMDPLPTMPKVPSMIKSPKQIQELKELVQTRELRVEGENKELVTKNFSLVEQVRKLQRELDKIDVDPMYDSLQVTYETMPSGNPIYSEAGLRRSIKSFTVDDVTSFLREVKLEAYTDKFKENFIDGELLATLTENEIYEELGMSRIQAKRLLMEVKKKNKSG